MKRGKMKFRKAKQDDKEEILALYQSLIGTPYCAWGNGYPGEQEFDYDMKRNALFCMENEDGEIIGTITVDEDPQVEALTCWSKTLQPVRSFPDSGCAPICRIRELPGSFCSMAWKN